MPRNLQHITWHDEASAAAENGEKVTTFCGVRVYQMPHMKDEIPTCTPCARELMAAHKAAVTKPAVSSGGAA